MTIYDYKQILDNIHDDIGFEDITTKYLVEDDKWAQAEIMAKDNGILAGMGLVHEILRLFDIEIVYTKYDGESVEYGEIFLEIEGYAQEILMVERTILNYLMHLSGIATTVKSTCERVHKINPDVRVACTRKTTPGLQKLEKMAVELGGGDTHRFRLDDCVLIKDNHIKLVGSVIEAIEKAKEKGSFTKKIEIEVESLDEAVHASMFGADIVMLDNMAPTEVGEVIETLKERRLRDNVLLEVSGGINPDNIESYAKFEVDVISSGFLTNNVKPLDMSLNIV